MAKPQKEPCAWCGKPIKRTGQNKDSFYLSGTGPLCEKCYRKIPKWPPIPTLPSDERLDNTLGCSEMETAALQTMHKIITENDWKTGRKVQVQFLPPPLITTAG